MNVYDRVPERVILVHESRSSWINNNSNSIFKNLNDISRFLASDNEVNVISGAIKDAKYEVKVLDYPNYDLGEIKSIIEAKQRSIFWNISDGYDYFIGANVPSFATFIKQPFIGSSTFTQALAQNKYFSKQIAKENNIPTACSMNIKLNNINKLERLLNGIQYPYIIKPNMLDNSIGYEYFNPIVNSSEEAFQKINTIYESGIQDILVEKFLPGQEYTVSCLHLSEWQYSVHKQIYDGEYISIELKEKYEINSRHQDFIIKPELISFSKTIVEALGVKDYCRIDFREDENGNPNFIEINTGTFLTSFSFRNLAKKMFHDNMSEMFSNLINYSYDRQIRNL